ncbi:HD domain-containing protein [Nitrosopumilus ureiphilus]|nr:hypothetical protein [Nitrosopumilus ureiphilus]
MTKMNIFMKVSYEKSYSIKIGFCLLGMAHPLEKKLKDCGDSSVCKYSKFEVIKEVLEKVVTSQIPFEKSVLNVQGAYYNDHGKEHFERIENNYSKMIEESGIELSCCEIYLALLSIWFHDIGLWLGRKEDESPEDARNHHHARVKDVIEKLVEKGQISKMDNSEETLLVSICAGHSRKIDLESIAKESSLNGEGIKSRLLSAILRIADSLDIDHRRAPETIFELFDDVIPEKSREHWEKHTFVNAVEFNRTYASIDIVTTFGQRLEELIEQYKLVHWVQEEIKNELQSVKSIFDDYRMPFSHVQLKDYASGMYIKSDIEPSGIVRIECDEDHLDSKTLLELSELFKVHTGELKVYIEIILNKGGRITIPLPIQYNVTSSETLEESIKKICNPLLIDVKVDPTSVRVIKK